MQGTDQDRVVTVLASHAGEVRAVRLAPNWTSASGVEAEIIDAPQRLQRQMSIGDLAAGPQSPAISEPNRLVGNPQELLRRIGLVR